MQAPQIFYVSKDEELIKRLQTGWYWKISEPKGPFASVQEAIDDYELVECLS